MSLPRLDATRKTQTTTYRWIRTGLTALCILLLAIVILIPGVLHILYRADSQVALGHAKTVRVAMQVTGMEQYSRGEPFSDAACVGGVAEGLYEKIIELSKVPGDFWVLQVDETGYQVKKFVYQEGEYKVWYESDSCIYTVNHDSTMINTEV